MLISAAAGAVVSVDFAAVGIFCICRNVKTNCSGDQTIMHMLKYLYFIRHTLHYKMTNVVVCVNAVQTQEKEGLISALSNQHHEKGKLLQSV